MNTNCKAGAGRLRTAMHWVVLLSIPLSSGVAYAADAITPRVVLHAHELKSLSVAFSPNGQSLASGGEDQQLIVWDLKTAHYQYVADQEEDIGRIRWLGEGKFIGFQSSYHDEFWCYDVEADRTVLMTDEFVNVTGDQDCDATGNNFAIVYAWGMNDDDKQPLAKSELHLFKVPEMDHAAVTFDKIQLLAVAMSPDGKTVAATGFELTDDPKKRELVLYYIDPSTGKPTGSVKQGVLNLQDRFVQTLRYTGDGKTIIHRVSTTKMGLLDVSTNTDRAQFDIPDGVQTVTYTADARLMAVVSGKKILVYSTADGKLAATLDGAPDAIYGIALSNDGSEVAAATGKDVAIWMLPAIGTAPAGVSVAVAPPAQQPDWKPAPRAPDHLPFADAQNKPYVSTAPAKEGDEPAEPSKYPEYRPSCAYRELGHHTAVFSADSKQMIYSKGRIDRPDVQVNISTGAISAVPKAMERPTEFLLSPDGKSFASSDYGKVSIIDIATGTSKKIPDIDRAGPMRFDRGGTMLCMACYDGHVRVYDIAAGKVVREFDCEKTPRGLAVSPDGTLLAVSGLNEKPDRTAAVVTSVWNLKTNALVAHVVGGSMHHYEGMHMADHVDVGTPLGFVDGGKKLFYRNGDFEYVVMNLEGARESATFTTMGRFRLAELSPDGRYFAGVCTFEEPDAEKPIIHIFDTATLTQVANLTGIAPRGYMWHLSFSPDGKSVMADSSKVELAWTLPATFPPPASQPAKPEN